MLGFGSAIYSQGTFGKGVQQGFVKSESTTDVQVANYVVWPGFAQNNSTVNVDIYGFQIVSPFLNIQNTSTIYSYPNGIVWNGNVDLGSGTTTMYSACKISGWDRHTVVDTTWTIQT